MYDKYLCVAKATYPHSSHISFAIFSARFQSWSFSCAFCSMSFISCLMYFLYELNIFSITFSSTGKLNHKELLGKIWGIDIGKFPAELSTINLFRQNVSNYENFPRVICSDILDITKGAAFKFPPPNASQYFDKV